jgi:hypothetical protein
MIRDWDTYVLSPRERRIVSALASALYHDPLGSGLTTGKLEASLGEVVDDVQAWLGTPHPVLRAMFRALLISIELSPVRFGLGPLTMSGLPLEARVLYLEALDASGAASLETWKSILGMAYFTRPIGATAMDLHAGTAPAASALHRLGRKSHAHEHAAAGAPGRLS